MSDADSITREEAIAEVARLRAEIARMREWDPVINSLQVECDRLRAEVERLTWNERTYFAEAERLRKDLAASEANLAALQARFDERPVPHSTYCDVTLRLKSKWAICTCGADQINARANDKTLNESERLGHAANSPLAPEAKP